MTISQLGYDDHVAQSLSLTPEGYVELFAITMSPPGEAKILFTLTGQNEVTWQGKVWESYAIHLTGYSMDSSGEVSRPSLSLGNQKGLFSRYVHSGWMDNAEIIRYRVLKNHLEINFNSFVKNTWRVSKVAGLGRQVAVFELRGALDGQFFILPGRAYYPPEFTTLSL